MDQRTSEEFFTVVSPGLEAVCTAELNALGISCQSEPGGVTLTGKLRELYLANLQLRTASRILVRFAEIQSRSFPDLYRKTLRLPWGRFIKPDQGVTFRVSCRESRLNHTQRVSETLDAAINRALGRETNPDQDSPQLILARIINDRIRLSIDSSGELLHRRGYRKAVTEAPLRESLAAGILRLLDWQGEQALADPMCGSGSFLLEGAMLARGQAPGLKRSFAFMNWPGYRAGLWKLLCDEASAAERELTVPLFGADASAKAIAAARENTRHYGHEEQIILLQKPFDQLEPRKETGLLVCNPPYGKRLKLGQKPESFYAELGRHLQRLGPGWRKALVCPDRGLVQATGLPFNELAVLDNGGLKVTLFATEP